MKSKYIILIILLSFFNLSITSAQTTEIRDIFFPTEKDVLVYDSFGDPRTAHFHEGVDIMGEQMMPLYSAIDGRVKSVEIPESSWGYAVTLEDSDGYTYHYLHINNDTPGTDDGNGGLDNAYAPGIKRGATVKKGDLIGWMGDSGNAENVGSHLHFEIRKPDKTPINPYDSIIAAMNQKPNFDVKAAMANSLTINEDKKLINNSSSTCESGSLIKLVDNDAVYYCGANGKRYAFPNEKIYFTWYTDFENVVEITIEEISKIPLGGNVTYRPGTRMVKLQTSPKVFAVGNGAVLRWVVSGESAEALYGVDWKESIDDLPDSFFFNYTIGEDIK
ncbi:MAG: M23 family metallopeptidase [Patescibacteria group bacterium]|jgi:hypothetical protein|nr:M23 family metallopeptidase [Patescibacteria group bacterium]